MKLQVWTTDEVMPPSRTRRSTLKKGSELLPGQQAIVFSWLPAKTACQSLSLWSFFFCLQAYAATHYNHHSGCVAYALCLLCIVFLRSDTMAFMGQGEHRHLRGWGSVTSKYGSSHTHSFTSSIINDGGCFLTRAALPFKSWPGFGCFLCEGNLFLAKICFPNYLGCVWGGGGAMKSWITAPIVSSASTIVADTQALSSWGIYPSESEGINKAHPSSLLFCSYASHPSI